MRTAILSAKSALSAVSYFELLNCYKWNFCISVRSFAAMSVRCGPLGYGWPTSAVRQTGPTAAVQKPPTSGYSYCHPTAILPPPNARPTPALLASCPHPIGVLLASYFAERAENRRKKARKPGDYATNKTQRKKWINGSCRRCASGRVTEPL